MITDEECLRRACLAAPDDDAPWGAYRDWLMERGRWVDAELLSGVRNLSRHCGPVQRFLPTALPVAERLDDGPDCP